jgi:hypothetical protein
MARCSSLIKSGFDLKPPVVPLPTLYFSSEKLPRIFGTLVLALPSKHKGGELHLTHAGKTEILRHLRSLSLVSHVWLGASP